MRRRVREDRMIREIKRTHSAIAEFIDRGRPEPG
jgi:hypothetical protein